MKIIWGSETGNFSLYRRMTKIKNFRNDFFKFQSLVYDMGSKGGNVLSRGGTIEKYPRAKQSLDSKISNDFQDFTWKWRYTSTRFLSMGFKDLITFESALKSSDPILFDYEMFGK